MSSPLEEAAEELTRTVAALNDSIRQAQGVRDDLNRLVEQSKITRRMVWVVTLGFALDVILTVAMALFGYQAVQNSDRIDNLVQVQQDRAICPLYRLFIEADTPQNRDRAASQGQDMAARARAFDVIRESYIALECK